MFKKLLLTVALSATGFMSYGANNIPDIENPNMQKNSISGPDTSPAPIAISTIMTAYKTWWSTNKLELSFEGTNYDLISNDGTGQGSSSIYTSEGIGFGMLTSAMIMYIYQTQPDSGITSDDYDTASARLLEGYNYWVAAENSSAEKVSKTPTEYWFCYSNELLVWTRGADGNPTTTGDPENPYEKGSATDGDFYMTGAVYLAALAYKIAGDSDKYNELISWSKLRSEDISSFDFNDNNTSNPLDISASTPTLPAAGDSSCTSNIAYEISVEPSKAVLPIMYLFSRDADMNPTDNPKLWQSLVDNTFNFIDVAQTWSSTNTSNGNLMYYPYTAHQDGSSYIVDSAGSSYDYDAGRNAENIGGYLVLSVSETDYNKTAAAVGSQLITSVIADPNLSTNSFYVGTNRLNIYGLSQQGQTLTSEQSTYYDKYVSTSADNGYYTTGNWLMSVLWMHMKVPSTNTNATKEGNSKSIVLVQPDIDEGH